MSTTGVHNIPVFPLPGGTFLTMGASSGSDSCSCSSSGSQDCCGPDVTAWFSNTMKTIESTVEKYQIGSPKYKKFWATLKLEKANLTSKHCPHEDCSNSVTLCQKCIDVSELGNLAYGAYSAFGTQPLPIFQSHPEAITMWGGFFAEVGVTPGRGFNSIEG